MNRCVRSSLELAPMELNSRGGNRRLRSETQTVKQMGGIGRGEKKISLLHRLMGVKRKGVKQTKSQREKITIRGDDGQIIGEEKATREGWNRLYLQPLAEEGNH